MIIDTHAHYDDKKFDGDREQLFEKMRQNGIEAIVNVGAAYDGNIKTLELIKKHDFIYGACGIHPDEIGCLNDKTFAELEEWTKKEKIVAIGEIGLDYHWDVHPRELQKKWFIRQIELARKKELPIIVHSRDAAKDTMDIISSHADGIRGIIHAYSGSKEMARTYVEMGFYLGIGGVVTFKNAGKLKEVVREIPLKRLVLETDCPYLTPDPNRGKRNDSLHLSYVVSKIAQLKEVSEKEVCEQTTKNAKELFDFTGEKS